MSLIGKEILGYKVIEKIGTGSFGSVYKVERKTTVTTTVRALKVINYPDKTEFRNVMNSMGGNVERTKAYFARALDQVLEEVRVFAMLSEQDNHNIVQYYENDVQENEETHLYTIYILMEYLTSLSEWIYDNTMTLKDVLNIAKSIGTALEICSNNNVMHRDIKLDNVFVSKDRKFKLGDFGIAKHTEGAARTNSIKGTPYYIAPEVYLGKEEYDGSVDLYSLGILLYYLLNHMRFPFLPKYPLEYSKEEEDEAFLARMRGEMPPAADLAPPVLSRIIEKAINPRATRYAFAKDFLADLAQATEQILPQELNKKVLDINASAVPLSGEQGGDIQNRKSFVGTMGYDETVVLNQMNTMNTYQDTIVLSNVEADRYYDAFQRPQSEQPRQSVPNRSSEMNSSNKQTDKKKSKKKMAFIMLLILCLCGMTVGVSAYINGNQKNKKVLEDTTSGTTQEEESTTLETTTQEPVTTQPTTIQSTTTQPATTQPTTTQPQTTKDTKVQVKDVVGEKYEKAKKIMENAGLKVTKKEKYDSKVKKGRVISQSIKAEKKVEKNTKITLYVSKGEKETTTQYIEPTTQYIPPTTQRQTTQQQTTQRQTIRETTTKKNDETDPFVILD